MKELSIDIETYSSVDLTKSGVYAYADAPDFTILLFAYAFDDEDVRITDIAQGETLPPEVIEALTDKSITKTAYNANFERVCLSAFYKTEMPPEQWRCSCIQAAELGLPSRLAGVAEALGLEQQKDQRGKSLINYFSKPVKAKGDDTLIRHMPSDAPDKWQIFKDYCKQDVEVERAIKRRLKKYPITAREQELWECDQRINGRGVGVDLNFVSNAIKFSRIYGGMCYDEAQRITGLENPKSVAQLKKWLEEETGREFKSLDKETIKDLLDSDISEKAKRVLILRSRMAKTSVTKYEAMERSVCADGRIRGLLQFYGANRTGRWAGRIVQVQNLPQNHLKDLEFARETVSSGGFEWFETLFGNVPQTLSELIRTALIPSTGRRFIVADFSAIEARVLSYLADEKWRNEVFKNNGDIYCASASVMFKVPVEKHGANAHLRQKGKIAELALGYGGSVGAMVSMGALKQGLTEEELGPIVDKWRQSNPNIVRFWKTVENAAVDAVNGYPSEIGYGISFIKESGILFVGLPSGRRIAYVKPLMGVNKFGSTALTYMGMNQTSGKWERMETWGGKLTENIVQAFARDCLAESILRLESKGFEVNFHVHDEVILDVPQGVSSVEEITEIMCTPIPWAEGLILNADGYETDFYKKD